MPKRLPLASVLIGVSLAACAPAARGQSTAAPATAPTPASTPAVSAAPTAAATFTAVPPLSAAPVRVFQGAAQVVDPTKTYRAVLTTTQGDITVELDAKAAPVAVNNFVFLALNRFYDGTRFHRVIEGFMAQGGDPLSADPAQRPRWGTGGPGYQFAAEVRSGLRFDRPGVLGMARSASLTSQGSQFFVTLAPADFLSGQYTVFGRVVAGQDVLARVTRTARSSAAGETAIPGVVPDTLRSVQILTSP
ncbi:MULTISPECIES: peptidylprolyl isomerase [Deinococcus]|uniref:Peptidyl-prolyl cis-trans isomerase n=1 Tax=Deinococcus rufus TaxID=2136097 RepID=A0ABV7Z613_9DEIO|nr:peptidylprolyl isomerase [Deinococcus sp. AB2017081]WQE96393.1 peptidylprolyl isomerase [Deinococcus sp. AB2017081]